MADQTASYSLGEEIANSVTHGVAAIFSVVGLILMVTLAALRSQSAVAVSGGGNFRGFDDCAVHGIDPLSRNYEPKSEKDPSGL